MVTMSCSGNLVWDVNKRLIGYSEPNALRTNYLGKNKANAFKAFNANNNNNAGAVGRRRIVETPCLAEKVWSC